MVDFATFDGLLKVYDGIMETSNNLISAGFAIHSIHVDNLHRQADEIIQMLNKNMGLKQDSGGYTTLDWFLENRLSDDLDLHRITIDGKEYMIYSNADCYNFISQVELK